MERADTTDRQSCRHVMLVEDDEPLARWIGSYLRSYGYQVSIAVEGNSALGLIREDTPDLVVLDWVLPGMSGIDVCRQARAFHTVPILMLTARDGDGEEVSCLDSGADDYLRKPVRPAVLLARVRALLRRGATMLSDHVLQVGGLRIDKCSRVAMADGEPLPLTSLELDILMLLTQNAGAVVERAHLVAKLRGFSYDGLNRSVDLAVSRLRRKIGDSGACPTRIKTVRGRGYLLAPDTW